MTMLSDERLHKLKEVVRKRQWNLTIVLENVHDPHNLGAVMRSCEAIGIPELYILYSKDTHNSARYIGRNATSGVGKWITPLFYDDLDECMMAVKKKYKKVLTTNLYQGAKSIYETNLETDVAIVLGNEKEGISKDLMAYSDGNIIIPIHGMAESLNVSVATSIIVFEASRQRMNAGCYHQEFDLSNPQMSETWQTYLQQARPRIYEKDATLLNQMVNEKIEQKKS